MRARWKWAAGAVTAALGVWAAAQVGAGARPLAGIVPASPLLYLEAKDFGGLVGEWNASAEKTAWLASANYQVFTRSYLYFKLKSAYDEFAAAAGLPPDMALVASVAGGESALALYDISKLEFLFVTRLAAARAMESALYRARGGYTSRAAAGATYYVKSDAKTQRTAAFAIAGGLLLLGTKEDALAGALQLLAGQGGPPATRQEAWYRDGVQEAPNAGELRLVANLARVAARPHFRSYWIQRNAPEIGGFRCGIADLRRAGNEWREDRVLLRGEPAPAPDSAVSASLSRLVPPTAGFFQMWASADTAHALDLLERKVLAPRPVAAVRQEPAPAAAYLDAQTGSEADLEARIDQAPAATGAAGFRPEPLRAALGTVRVNGVLLVQSGRAAPDGVFAGNDAGVAISGAVNWNASMVQEAVRSSVAGIYSTSGLGLGWTTRNIGAQSVAEMDGLKGIAVAARGNLLVVATTPELAAEMLSASGPPRQAHYAAGFQLRSEAARFDQMMRLMDRPPLEQESREPFFFSENIASLARVMGRLERMEVTARDTGAAVNQSVLYRLSP